MPWDVAQGIDWAYDRNFSFGNTIRFQNQNSVMIWFGYQPFFLTGFGQVT
jgi:hypothetical protein